MKVNHLICTHTTNESQPCYNVHSSSTAIKPNSKKECSKYQTCKVIKEGRKLNNRVSLSLHLFCYCSRDSIHMIIVHCIVDPVSYILYYVHWQSTLRPTEVHSTYVQFNVTRAFVLRVWEIMICVPRTWWHK